MRYRYRVRAVQLVHVFIFSGISQKKGYVQFRDNIFDLVTLYVADYRSTSVYIESMPSLIAKVESLS